MATNERYTYSQFLTYVQREGMKWTRTSIHQSEILKKVIPEDLPRAMNLLTRVSVLNTFKNNIKPYVGKGISKKQLDAPILNSVLLKFQENNPEIDGNDTSVVYSLLSLLNKEVAEQYRKTSEDMLEGTDFPTNDIKDILKEEKKKVIPSFIMGKNPKDAHEELIKRARMGVDKMISQLQDNIDLLDGLEKRFGVNSEIYNSVDNRAQLINQIQSFPQEMNKVKQEQLFMIGGNSSSSEFGLEKKDLDKINKLMKNVVITEKTTGMIKPSVKKLYKTKDDYKNTLESQIFNHKISGVTI